MEYTGTGVHVPRTGDERAKKMLERISRGIRHRKKHADEWDKNEKRVYMEHQQPSYADKDYVCVNKCGAWLESRVAALTYKQFQYRVKPSKPDGWDAIPVPVIHPVMGPTGEIRSVTKASVIEAVLNGIISHPNFGAYDAVARFVANAQMSMGVLYVGYTADYEMVEDEIPELPLDQVVFQDPQYIIDNYEHTKDDSGATVPEVTSRGTLIPKGRKPISEQWFMDCVPARKMVFDPDGEDDFLTHSWIAMEVVRPLSDVKKDKRFKNTKELKATTYSNDDDGTTEWDDELHVNAGKLKIHDEDVEFVRLFYYWDFGAKKWYALADGCGEILMEEDFPDGVDVSTGPFVFYRPIERSGQWYPHPPISNGRPISEWFDAAKTQELKDMRKSSRKILYDAGTMSEDDASRISSPYDEVIAVKRDKLAGPLGENVFEFAVGGVNPQTFAHASGAEYAFDEAMGSPGETRGVASSDTATQAKMMGAHLTLREDYQRSKLRLALIDAGRKLLKSIQANATVDQYVEIAGEDGMLLAVNASPDMLTGDYDISIDIEEMVPQDKVAQQANLTRLLQIAAAEPLLVADEDANDVIFGMFGVTDQRLTKGIARIAQMKMQMMMAEAASKRDTAQPGTPASSSDAEAIAQQGGQQ